ncbi:MAG: ATP-binding protein [Actinomycetota bacterium]|nr:ATP-binding protein [Actinomycetota bacterium]
MELVVLCGLQASGKSTFRRERLSDHVVVSKDLLRNNRRPERRQRQLVDEALAAGRCVVVDNTNPSPEDRRPLVAIARRHGAITVAYYFDEPFDACLRRNAARPDRQRVPEVGLFDVRRRLQPPARDEGFDERWRVRLAAAGGFRVTPLPAQCDWNG